MDARNHRSLDKVEENEGVRATTGDTTASSGFFTYKSESLEMGQEDGLIPKMSAFSMVNGRKKKYKPLPPTNGCCCSIFLVEEVFRDDELVTEGGEKDKTAHVLV